MNEQARKADGVRSQDRVAPFLWPIERRWSSDHGQRVFRRERGKNVIGVVEGILEITDPPCKELHAEQDPNKRRELTEEIIRLLPATDLQSKRQRDSASPVAHM
jgi:hypothetical protein